MYKYIMARLAVNLTLLGVLATLPLSQGHGLVARPTEDDPSPARSYHLHVQFVAGAAASTAKALKLRRAYASKWGNKTCTGLFDQGGPCLYPVDRAPNGPFISGNWAAFLPTENYEAVLAWITRRRGDLSIFFHPNSGHVVHDHFRYSTWVGRPWPLNVEPLLWSGKDPLETCNEWECYYGTSGGWGGV